MVWIPGESIHDFFTRYLEEAARAGLTAKTACIFMVSQVPHEVQQKLKEWIRAKVDTLSVEEAVNFGPTLRQELAEKAIPVDRGFHEGIGPKVSTVTEQGVTEGKEDETSDDTPIQFVRPTNRAWSGMRRDLKCYACVPQNISFVSVPIDIAHCVAKRATTLVPAHERDQAGEGR